MTSYCKYDINDFNKVTDDQLDAMAEHMDDDIREQVNSELAPCSVAEFLERYYELDEKGLDAILDGFSLTDTE